MKYPRKRDANEPAIVRALVAAGASVQRLDGTGLPDLLVGRRVLVLLEVKEPDAAKRAGGEQQRKRGGDGDRTAAQVKWWDAWRGPAPVIVTTPAEAIAALERAEAAVTVYPSPAPAVDLDDIPF